MGGADPRTGRRVPWARRAPANVGRLSADGRAGAQGSAHVSYRETGTRSAARLAHGGGGDACRHGEHRVYWRPVYAVLEGHVELIVGNARHIRNVPGRKTDVKDAEWIADLV